jgi:hypothetical protein
MITETIRINVDTSSATNNVDNLNDSIRDVGSNTTNIERSGNSAFKNIGNSVRELFPAFDGAISGMKGMLVQMWAIVANPLGAILAAIVLTMTALFMVFKNFQPIVDKVEQAMAALSAVFNVVSNTVVALFTGTKSLGEAFNGLGGDMKKAAVEAAALAKAQQDLEDVLASQEVQTARNRAEINKLNVQAKNRTLSEQERLKLLERAAKLEDADYQQRLKNANQEVINARRAIEIKAGFNEREKKFLKEQGQAAKELAESKGGNYDDEFKKLSEAQRARISLEDEATSNLEKNQNKRDKLEDDAKEKRERAIADQQAAAEKRRTAQEAADKIEDEKRKAREAYQASVNAGIAKLTIDSINAKVEEQLLEEQNQQKRLQNIADEVDAIEQANAKKVESDKKAADEQIALEQSVKNAKVNIASQTLGLISEIAGRGSKIGKATAALQATISGIEGVQNAFTTASKSPITTLFPAYPFIQAGLAGAFSAVQVKNILKATPSNSNGSTASGGGSQGGGAPSAPSFNLVQGTGANQIASSLATQNKPIQAYVVSSNVTTAQSLDRNIIENSKI